jgi:hypothetical protein
MGQASELKQGLRERTTDFVNREPGKLHRFGEHRFGPGPGDFERDAWPPFDESHEFRRPSA